MKYSALVILFVGVYIANCVYADDWKKWRRQAQETTTEMPMVQGVKSETTPQPENQQAQSVQGENKRERRMDGKWGKDWKRQADQMAETTSEMPMVQGVMSESTTEMPLVQGVASELTTELPMEQQLQSGQGIMNRKRRCDEC